MASKNQDQIHQALPVLLRPNTRLSGTEKQKETTMLVVSFVLGFRQSVSSDDGHRRHRRHRRLRQNRLVRHHHHHRLVGGRVVAWLH